MDKNTRIKIKQLDFVSFDDKTLGWRCIEPTIQKIRGKNVLLKSQVYAQLTPGQQSLLMFWILYGHAQNGIAQFYNEINYLFTQTDIWLEFKDKFKLFGDDDLIHLVKEMESMYLKRQKNLNDFDSKFTLTMLDTKFNEIIPKSVKRIGTYIRNNPEEFVNLEL